MAGILKVDDLRGNTSAGDITITSEGGSATMQLQQGVAKAWCHWGQSDHVSDDTLNIASLTDVAVGRSKINYTNVMSNANYVGHSTAQVLSTKVQFNLPATTHLEVFSRDVDGGSGEDLDDVGSSVVGDLA